MNTGIVILAAGQGSRLSRSIPKPLVPLLGIPLIGHVLAAIPKEIPINIIVSPKHRTLFSTKNPNHIYLIQSSPKGTAHALVENYDTLRQYDALIVLNADTPLVSSALIQSLIDHPMPNTLIAFRAEDTAQYGQITKKNELAISITEAKDRQGLHCSNLCYSGIMKLSTSYLKQLLTIPPSPTTNEYYLTSLVSPEFPFHIQTCDPHSVLGVNTPQELITAEKVMKASIVEKLLANAVSLDAYQSIHITADTLIGHGCHLAANVTLKNCTVGKNCTIGQGAILTNTTIADNVTILPYSIISDSVINQYTTVGPFAHIQSQSNIGEHCHIGNFVEVKRSIIKQQVKAKHLSYLGDAYVDHNSNIGAGVITCNYVPWRSKKEMTYIGSYALIGAGSLLIAPAYIGDHAICAAGTIVTKLIQPYALAISRPNLVIKNNYLKSKMR